MQGDDLAVAAAAVPVTEEKVEESEEKHRQQPPQHEEAVSVFVLWFLGDLGGVSSILAPFLGVLGVGVGVFFDTGATLAFCVWI